MGELRIDCGRCGIEFAVTSERVKACVVNTTDIERALASLFGGTANSTKTEYRIYCPKCNRAIAKFVSPVMGI